MVAPFCNVDPLSLYTVYTPERTTAFAPIWDYPLTESAIVGPFNKSLLCIVVTKEKKPRTHHSNTTPGAWVYDSCTNHVTRQPAPPEVAVMLRTLHGRELLLCASNRQCYKSNDCAHWTKIDALLPQEAVNNFTSRVSCVLEDGTTFLYAMNNFTQPADAFIWREGLSEWK